MRLSAHKCRRSQNVVPLSTRGPLGLYAWKTFVHESSSGDSQYSFQCWQALGVDDLYIRHQIGILWCHRKRIVEQVLAHYFNFECLASKLKLYQKLLNMHRACCTWFLISTCRKKFQVGWKICYVFKLSLHNERKFSCKAKNALTLSKMTCVLTCRDLLGILR